MSKSGLNGSAELLAEGIRGLFQESEKSFEDKLDVYEGKMADFRLEMKRDNQNMRENVQSQLAETRKEAAESQAAMRSDIQSIKDSIANLERA